MKIFTIFILALAATLFAANNSQAKYLDDETDLIYYGSRYYSPTQGKWIGRDSAGEQKGGNNLFVFCNNSPFNFFDNDGRIATAAYWWNVMYTMEKGIAQAEAMGEADTVERLQGRWSQACNQFGKACVNEEAVGGIAEGFDEGVGLLGVAVGPLNIAMAGQLVIGYVVDKTSQALGPMIKQMTDANNAIIDYWSDPDIKWNE
jgi:RHS repeat-associated protein